MTTPPIVALPSSAKFAEIVFSLQRVVGKTASPYTLQGQFYKWPGEQWLADVTVPPIVDREIAGQWKAFGAALQGSFGQFYMGDPSAIAPVGIGTGTPLVKGAGQTGNSLIIDGLTPSVTGILKAGDWVQVGTGTSSRLHMQTADVNSNGAGEATLTLEPALRYSPADNSAVSFHNTVGLFRMQSNTFEWRVLPGPIYMVSFQAEEVIGS